MNNLSWIHTGKISAENTGKISVTNRKYEKIYN
jgi:hypothetical protein